MARGAGGARGGVECRTVRMMQSGFSRQARGVSEDGGETLQGCEARKTEGQGNCNDEGWGVGLGGVNELIVSSAWSVNVHVCSCKLEKKKSLEDFWSLSPFK